MQSPFSQSRSPIIRAMRIAVHVGRRRECPCCGSRFRSFRSAGRPRRPEAACPRCGSRERHRLLTDEVRRRPELGGRVLHFAPEPATEKLLRSIATEYVSSDLLNTADVQADLTDLPFPDARWDVIVCSHVLEHVRDDRSAMRELRRVLSPGGRAILMVPRTPGRPTEEDPTETDPAELRRRFGQEDHVRLYGDDLEQRLKDAGLDIIEPITPEHFTREQIERHRLRPVGGGAGEAAMFCGSST